MEVEPPWPAGPPHSPRKRPRSEGSHAHACLRCVEHQEECDRSFPCGRCFRLSLTCELPPEVMQQLALPNALGFALVIQRTDPLLHAHNFLRAFHRMTSFHGVDYERCRATLRTWRTMAVRAGRDVTFGVLNSICQTLGYSPVELEEPKETLMDTPALLAARDPFDPAVRQRFATSPTYRLLDDGVTGAFVHFYEEGRLVMCANPAAQSLFYNSVEVRRLLSDYKIAPFLVLSSLIAPEDQEAFSDVAVAFAFLKPSNAQSAFVKMYNREGGMDLCMFKARLVTFPEYDNQSFVVNTLEKVPNSRYIIDPSLEDLDPGGELAAMYESEEEYYSSSEGEGEQEEGQGMDEGENTDAETVNTVFSNPMSPPMSPVVSDDSGSSDMGDESGEEPI